MNRFAKWIFTVSRNRFDWMMAYVMGACFASGFYLVGVIVVVLGALVSGEGEYHTKPIKERA